ncbi:MAG TPA: hypothetical protein VLA67_05820 [Nitrospiraceae bacterium]|nr:hypothetical protein [Nitrospiraceae bacterium]
MKNATRSPLLILLLGMSVSTGANDVFAIMVGSSSVRIDPKGIDERLNVPKPGPRWPPDAILVANEQPVENKRAKKQDPPVEDPKKGKVAAEDPKQPEPVAEEPPIEETKPVSPVGVAPDSPQETLPHAVFSRIIDLPGAGVLTPKGTLVVEPYLQFAHLSSNRVTLTGFTIVPAITIGLINVQGVSRNIYTGALVGRYGLTNRLELELRIPYLYRDDTYTLRPIAVAATRDTVEEFTGSGLGDIETTARYQINKGGPDDPYFVGFLRFKSTTGKGPFDVPINPITGFQEELPTGSGFYILQPGLTVLYPSDPAVLFGSVSFIWNMPRDVGGQIGTVEPGNGANANLGLGISLNEKLSLSLGYDHTVFARPTSASNLLLTTAPTVTHVGVLLLGAGYQLSNRTFVNFVVGVGATREAPDLQVTLRIPTALFSPK